MIRSVGAPLPAEPVEVVRLGVEDGELPALDGAQVVHLQADGELVVHPVVVGGERQRRGGKVDLGSAHVEAEARRARLGQVALRVLDAEHGRVGALGRGLVADLPVPGDARRRRPRAANSFWLPADECVSASFQDLIPSFTVTSSENVRSSRIPSPFGEKPAADAVTYSGVGRVSTWIPRSSFAVVLPDARVAFTT